MPVGIFRPQPVVATEAVRTRQQVVVCLSSKNRLLRTLPRSGFDFLRSGVHAVAALTYQENRERRNKCRSHYGWMAI